MNLPLILKGSLAAVDLALSPYFVFLLLVASAAWLNRKRGPAPLAPGAARPRFLFVVPAHNEESGVAETVRSLLGVDYPRDRFDLTVIADNCDDATADVARKAGAHVVERFDAQRKSKGFAIEHLIDRLKAEGAFEGYDALVIVDADSTVDQNLLERFAAQLNAGRDWAQCHYAVSNADDSWRTRLMAYAFSLFNGMLPMGLGALGLGVPFRGNGMCLSTRGLSRFPWKAYGLVEDIEFSWDLRVSGERPAFEAGATVRGVMLSGGGAAASSQRRRWEYGRKDVTRKFLRQATTSPHLGPFAKAAAIVELTMPGTVTLGFIYLGVAALNLVGFVWWREPLMAVWIALSTLAMALYALGPFVFFGIPWRYVLSLARLPYYAGWKAWVALQGRPGGWVRTAREPNPSAGENAGRPAR
ncbi:MAG: glycosyltransferase family 2 protein [Isosphaeraceae bacterium]